MSQKFAPPRVIAIDVDGTLVDRFGIPNRRLIAWCRTKKKDGFFLMLWSSRGEAHARAVTERFGIAALFDLICSKPGYVVDDQGWGWIRYTRVVHRLDAELGIDHEQGALSAIRK